MFGCTTAEAVGRHIFSIVPAKRRSAEDDVLAHLRRAIHFETERQTKDGRRVRTDVDRGKHEGVT
jgi:hypothetical protein